MPSKSGTFFFPIENELRVPEAKNEYGCIGEHFVLLIPSNVLVTVESADSYPTVFRLQIKTLFSMHGLRPGTILVTN